VLFDDLISHCRLEDDCDSDFSFSHHKFEKAVTLLKERENQRVDYRAARGQLQHEVDFLKMHVKELSEELRSGASRADATQSPEYLKLLEKNKKLK
jgi:hypothetical protein